MPQLHSIHIDPTDDESWINWGRLIYDWAGGKTTPINMAELEEQWRDYKVFAKLEGPDVREVSVQVYDNTDTTKKFVLSIPTRQMIDDDREYLKRQRKYPLPAFYDQVYEGNPARRRLSETEISDLGFARLGEYVINECM
jgi:hypothetical protein